MLNIERKENFLRRISKVKDNSTLNQIKKKIKKIIENPEIGKPIRYVRKGTREVYIGSFRLSYVYLKEENKLVFLDFYHKDKQ
ncbi:MAG: type II toxin-antitoxin system RelE/ParE family toxin [archaeon]